MATSNVVAAECVQARNTREHDLAWLLEPLARDSFLRIYWAQAPARIEGRAEDYFQSLLGEQDF